MLKFGLIVGSTRPNRFAEVPAEWVRAGATERRDQNAFVGYGGAGGVRAIEQLRSVVIELQMAPIKHEVNISVEPYLGVLMHGKKPDDYLYLTQARTALFDNLVWWAR
jgi:NAD(P)H-dependent FMN reductase